MLFITLVIDLFFSFVGWALNENVLEAVFGVIVGVKTDD